MTPTPDQLRAAFIRERPYHPDWPDTLGACLTVPLIRAMLETYARHPPALHRIKAPRWTPPARPQIAPGRGVNPETQANPSPPIDRKRLASGERDTEPPELDLSAIKGQHDA